MATFTRFPANTTLRDRMGTVTLAPQTLAAMQTATANTRPDIMPIVNDALHALGSDLNDAAAITYGREDFLSPIARHVMDIKSITGLFGHDVASSAAGVMLDFLETTGRLDNTVLDMLRAFLKITRITLDPSLTEYDANKHLSALTEACKRYRDKSDKIINA